MPTEAQRGKQQQHLLDRMLVSTCSYLLTRLQHLNSHRNFAEWNHPYPRQHNCTDPSNETLELQWTHAPSQLRLTPSTTTAAGLLRVVAVLQVVGAAVRVVVVVVMVV
eukprot:scaffold122434_cov18-Tisochrysis_lutea.AAC.1